MSLKHLIALTVIHQSLEPGVAASKDGKTPAVAPTSRVIQPFKKTGVAFIAKDADQQAELFRLECVAVAPEGTPLAPEDAEAVASPVKKTVSSSSSKLKSNPSPSAAAVAATKAPASSPISSGKTDGNEMV